MSRTGPIEARAWPAELPCHVVTPDADPRIHGYALEQDLARHYGFGAILRLALTGELPTADEERLLDLALCFAAATTVAHAPVHASVLAALSGSPAVGVHATASIALAEEAHATCRGAESFLAWLAAPSGSPPRDALAAADHDGASVARLRAALDRVGLRVPALDAALSREAAVLAVLFAAGLRTPASLATALALARLPVAMAEALAVRPLDFRAYPMDLPAFTYADPEPR